MKVPLPILERRSNSAYLMATLHYKRRQRALRDAFELMENTKEQQSEVQPSTTKPRKQSIGEQLQLFDADTWEELKWIRGPKLRKRFVSQLSFRDIGETRLVMGELVEVTLIGQVARLTVSENNQQIDILFGRAFIEEPFNNQYLNNFYILQSYIGKAFTCVGVIRSSEEIGRLQCHIQFGTDFKVDNLNLVEVAYKG